jgi:hypothetical protein
LRTFSTVIEVRLLAIVISRAVCWFGSYGFISDIVVDVVLLMYPESLIRVDCYAAVT